MSSQGFTGGLGRFSVTGDAFNRTSVGHWQKSDEQELTEAVAETAEQEAALEESASIKERKERRAAQFSKIARNSVLTVTEKASLAGVALDAGVEQYAIRMAQRLKNANVRMPTVEVRWKDLTMETQAVVGTSALPTLLNWLKECFEMLVPCVKSIEKQNIRVLKNISGILKPGKATLLLGPPGSGKTHLQKVLSGRTVNDKLNKLSGEISYNGHHFNEFEVRRSSAYIDQIDLHLPTLTVRETFDFAAMCMGEGALPKLLEETRVNEKKMEAEGKFVDFDPELDALMAGISSSKQRLYVELIISLLRLTNAADTVVGDAMLRGISGGERKRTTSGEMMVGPVTCFFMDEISTGLDSSATFAISEAMVHFAHILERTIIIALLQPDPLTYDLFDDIMVLAEGRIIYHGAREQVMPFFNSIGFQCHSRKGIADFLQEVTSPKDQAVLRADKNLGAVYMPVSHFENAWKKSDQYLAMMEELNTPYPKDQSHPLALSRNRYGVSSRAALKAQIWRHHILQRGDIQIIGYRVLQGVVMGFILGTTYFRRGDSNVNDGVQIMGVLYYSLMYMILDSVPEVAITIERKAVFYKQRDNNFFPAWSYAVPLMLMDLPILFLEVLPYCILVYWIAGFAATAGQFFLFILIHYLTIVYADSMYRALGAAAPDLVLGNAISSFILLVTLVTSGFTIIKKDIPGWWIWAYWINPYAWGLRALAISEFHSSKWDDLVGNPDVANSPPTERLGTVMLGLYDVYTDFNWVWYGIVVLVGFFGIMGIAPVLTLTYNNPPRHHMTIAKYEDPEDKAVAEGELIRQSVNSANGVEKKAPVKKDDISIPFEPMTVVFRDLCYFVPKPGDTSKELQLLKGIWGHFQPGVLTALMGASGAGKTTLMDVIAGRKTGGRIEGEMLLNGFPKDQETFARVMGYVEQSDIHSPQLTVYESLVFSAMLRLPTAVPRADKLQFIDQMMDLVELDNLTGALVGVPGESGLSVEQRKRLTIAVELVANPSVIFMDEPTSGLDARAAAIVMRVVKNISRNGRTVTCTIHQPSTEIFEAFDQLLLLKRGGWTVYFGLLGDKSITLIEYFYKYPGVPKYEPHMNPSTYALEITGGFTIISGVSDFATEYTNSDAFKATQAEINQLATPPPGAKALAFKDKYASSFIDQYRECLHKNVITYWRSPTYNMNSRLMMTLIIALVLGTLYLNQGKKVSTFMNVNNVIGALYLFAMFIGYQNTLSVQPVVAYERTVFYREVAARTYSFLPYSLAEATVEIPYLILQGIMFTVVLYWLVDFPSSAGNVFFFMLVVCLNNACFTFVGEFMVHVTPNVQLASVLASGVMGIWKLFSGYIITEKDLPKPWIWMYYGNPLTYVLYALSVKIYGNNLTEIVYDNETFTIQRYLADIYYYQECCHPGMWACVGILFAFIILLRTASFIALKTLNFQSR